MGGVGLWPEAGDPVASVVDELQAVAATAPPSRTRSNPRLIPLSI
jgi:hypothetical protein